MSFTIKKSLLDHLNTVYKLSWDPARNIAIFATGGKWPDEWGSGMKKLLDTSELVKDRLALVLTNYEEGWVSTKFKWIYPEDEYNLDSPNAPLLDFWTEFPKRWENEKFSREDQAKIIAKYQQLMKEYGIEYVFLSGWMKQVLGLKANKVVNIHPGPIHGEYGWEKMYGDNVHKKIWEDYFDGRIVSSAVTMHFVPSGVRDKMDTWPIIVQVPIPLAGCTKWEDVKDLVNTMEREIQWQITEHVVNGKITWSGKKGELVKFTEWLSILVKSERFLLDGKAADMSPDSSYAKTVIGNGDAFSEWSKSECDSAMKETLAYKDWLVKEKDGSWETVLPPSEVETFVKKDIDGVGTKVQIYLIMFEALCELYKNGEISLEICLEKSTDLWVRMLHDLIAMNADDLRDGQMAVMVSNIIDINHLNGERWRVFGLSMIRAMWIATREIGIGNGVGETAVLWDSFSVAELKLEMKRVLDLILSIPNLTKRQRAHIDKGIKAHTKRMQSIGGHIDFNIGWTVQGVRKNNKLVPLEEGYAIVALYEKPDKNGIIWPRSNGLTAIRKNMNTLAGGGKWPNMTFENFLEYIWPEQAAKLPEELRRECSWLLLGQIATGMTTVYNQFISRDLLGGFKGKPSVKIASIIHVTGNPLRKIQGGLRWGKDLGINMDISKSKIPQIIQIIQHLTGMSDEVAAKSFNMWVPEAIICPVSEVATILTKAGEQGLTGENIGTVVKHEEWHPRSVVTWVGIGKSAVSIA